MLFCKNMIINAGRVTKRRLGLTSNCDTDLTYVTGYDGSQTALLSEYQSGSDAAYEYAYDDNGNITSITQGTTSVTYQYNGANELVRENNGFTNKTVIYTYDRRNTTEIPVSRIIGTIGSTDHFHQEARNEKNCSNNSIIMSGVF